MAKKQEQKAEAKAAEERESLRVDRQREQEVDVWGREVLDTKEARQVGYLGRATSSE